jgi:hypothetical protein
VRPRRIVTVRRAMVTVISTRDTTWARYERSALPMRSAELATTGTGHLPVAPRSKRLRKNGRMFGAIAVSVGADIDPDDYFAEATLMNLDDLEYNTRDGLHIAQVGGCLDRRGRRIRPNARPRRRPELHTPPPGGTDPPVLRPMLSRSAAKGRGQASHQARYSLLAGPPPQIIHHGQAVTVTTPSGELRDPKARRGRGPKSTLRTTPGTAATRGLNVAVSERGGHER